VPDALRAIAAYRASCSIPTNANPSAAHATPVEPDPGYGLSLPEMVRD
jgi:hypothetical protein